MLTFLKKRQSQSAFDENQKFIGQWKLDNATIVYFGKEMELEPEEFEIIEDSLDCGIFIISGFHYTYSGNRLFPSAGSWQVNVSSQITLLSNDQIFVLDYKENKLVYQLKVDEFICYNIFFVKA